MNLFRCIRDGYRWFANPYGFLDDALHRHGLTFRIRLPVLGQVLMTGDPRLIAEVVHHKDLDAGKSVTPALAAIMGQRSLIMLDGQAHAARHRLLAPLFRGESLRAYDELTVRWTHDVLSSWTRGETFSMYEALRRIGLKAMVAAMFGDSGTDRKAEEKVALFLNSFKSALVLFCRPLRVDAGAWSPWGRALRNRLALCDFIRREMQACRASPGSPTILERLLTASLPEDDTIEEVLSLLLFGHDTAAATMAWAFAHIYGDAPVLERVRAEATAADNIPPDPASLPFLKACIEESMRLCPVVVHLARTASADIRIGDYAIERGQKVIPCTYLAQHNPEVFAEPWAFRPERFLNGQRYEHAYFPFGFGQRTCIGKPFAMRQMLLVIATAVRAFDLELAPGYRPAPARQLVLIVPRYGTPMRRRADAPAAISRRVMAS
jgi:cytochrome P450